MPQNTGSKLLQGNIQRVYLVNTEEAWAQDDFTVNQRLSVNFGVRWSIPGVVHDAANDLYQFNPATASFQQGLYPNYYGGFGPRVGFAYAPNDNARTVLRGAFGIFYDLPPISNSISGTTANGGASYTQNNPAGARSSRRLYRLERSRLPARCQPLPQHQPSGTRRIQRQPELPRAPTS